MTPRNADHIGIDRPCPRCGYNLRGLGVPGRCPECGEVIRRSRSTTRFTDTLADAPFYYLRPLAGGLMLMGVASVGGALALGYARGPWRWYGAAWAVVFALGWWVGVWIVTRPRPIVLGTLPDAVLDSPRVRGAIRLTQLVWLGAAGGWAVAAFAPLFVPPPAAGAFAPPPVLGPIPAEIHGRRMAIAAEVIGLLSLVPLSVLLCGLASWSGNGSLAERFRIAAWGLAGGGVIGIASTLVGSLTSPVAGLLRIVGLFAWAIALIALLLVVISLAELAYSAVWAISNAHTRSQVEDRLARKQAQYEQELADRVATADAAGPSPPAAPVDVLALDRNYLPRSRGGAAPYPVAPEPDGESKGN